MTDKEDNSSCLGCLVVLLGFFISLIILGFILKLLINAVMIGFNAI